MELHPTEQHDGWFERCQFSLEQYRTGAGLTLADKRALHDSRDLWKIALIQNTLPPCQDRIYASLQYRPETVAHYFGEEKLWLRDEFYYLGVRLARQPTAEEKEQDFEKQRTHIRFRLFYALKWPVNMKRRENLVHDEAALARAFFTRAEEISFRDYIGQFFGTDGKERAERQQRMSEAQGLALKAA